MKKKLQKIISGILLFSFLSLNFSPLVFAQNSYQNTNGQYKSVTEGSSDKSLGEKSQEAAKGVAQVALVCAISTLASNMIKTGLSAALSAASEWLSSWLSSTADDIIEATVKFPKVPVIDSDVRKNTSGPYEKEVSIVGAKKGLVETIMDLFRAPGLDAIGFCLVNEMIHYILRATIEWVKSGFQGQPVFIDNPEVFFQEIADREAGALVQEIIGGETGIDICQPFKLKLVTNFTSKYNKSYKDYSKCSLSQIKDTYENYLNDWNQGGLPGWFELIQNNYWKSNYEMQRELSKRTQTRQNSASLELGWGKGFRSFKYCEGPSRADGTCEPKYAKTGTPGDVVENAVNLRIGSPQKRLEFSDEFDELVSSLVNQLIRISVNELFGQDSSGQKSQTPFY